MWHSCRKMARRQAGAKGLSMTSNRRKLKNLRACTHPLPACIIFHVNLCESAVALFSAQSVSKVWVNSLVSREFSHTLYTPLVNKIYTFPYTDQSTHEKSKARTQARVSPAKPPANIDPYKSQSERAGPNQKNSRPIFGRRKPKIGEVLLTLPALQASRWSSAMSKCWVSNHSIPLV